MAIYYFLLHCWLWLGTNESAVRDLSAILLVVSIAALYGFGTILFGKEASLTVAFLLGINAVHIEQSQEAPRDSLLILSAGIASIIYVDKDNACPGSGTSQSPYCSVQNALNVAVAGTDIRIQAASTPYDESAIASTSGTATNPIVLEADDPTNPPILGGSSMSITLTGLSYWTIQNLVFDGGSGPTPGDGAIRINGGNWTTGPVVVGNQILNNTFKNWNNNTVNRGYYGGSAVTIQGGWAPPVGAYLPTNTVIRGNVFDGDRLIALSITSTNNTLVESNEFKNLNCGTQNDGGGGTAVVTDGVHEISGTPGVGSGTVYRHNSFHDFITTCRYTQSVSSYTEISAIHADVGPSNGVIDGNLVYNLDPTNLKAAAIALFIEDGCHGWTIKNNAVHDIGVAGGRNQPNSAGAVNSWFNNTFYNTGLNGLQVNSGDAVVENNIFDYASSAQIRTDALSLGNVTIDYNDYWSTAGKQNVGSWHSDASVNLSSWQTACNCDAHSKNADPQFISTADFHLRSTSPAVDAGLTILSISVDYDGTTRPQGVAYDIGAYEYH